MRKTVLTIALPCIVLAPAIGCRSSSGLPLNAATGGSTEEWTILCYEFTGRFHRSHCEQVAQTMARTPDIRAEEIRCDHDDLNQRSALYYGRYVRKIDDRTGRPTPSKTLATDLNLVSNLTDDANRRYFVQARPVPAVASADRAPRKWALINAPGRYSLQIAVFYPERHFTESRRLAVELVRELRREGHRAYYHHGTVQSMVTVGSFDESAFIIAQDGTRQLSPEVKALQKSDPRFRYNYENGQVRSKIIGGRRVPSPSFLVSIPGKEDS